MTPGRRPNLPRFPLIPELPYMPAADRQALFARCRKRSEFGWPLTLLFFLVVPSVVTAVVTAVTLAILLPREPVPMLSAAFRGGLLVACFFIPQLLVARRMRPLVEQELRAAGRCPACGYDVRATPDAAGPRLPTCPECGAATGE